MELSDKVAGIDILDESVLDQLLDIVHYLTRVIREIENEPSEQHPPPQKRIKLSASGPSGSREGGSTPSGSGEGRSAPSGSGEGRSAPSGSGEGRSAPSGSRSRNRIFKEGDRTDTPSQRRSLPPGARRVYKSERPGRTSREYETATAVSEEIGTSRRSEILNSLSPRQFGEYICEIATARHSIEDIRKLVRTDRTLPVDVESAYSRIQSLLELPNVVANIANWEIGSILHRLQSDTETPLRFESETALCNYAEEQKVECFKQITADCAKAGCTACSSVARAERRCPCAKVQKFTKLTGYRFTNNFTPTYLEQVHTFHQVCSESSILATCAEPPSVVRKMALKAASTEDDILDSLHLPTYASGTKDVFFVVGNTIECVHYVDGDGGSLVAEFIPGLLQYATAKGVPMQHVSSHNYTLIPFREKYHDAIELGHTYNITCEQPCGESVKYMMEYGYLALTRARQNANLAKKTYIVPGGMDASGCRLLVEIYYDAGTKPQANGMKLIELGLSFPSIVAPKSYSEALKTAKERKVGVYEHGEEIGKSPLLPWELKETLCERNECEITFVRTNDRVAVTCIVTNQHGRLNESHLMIAKSCIPGAGLGLFLRPKPLSCRSRIVIPAGKMLCLFSKQSIGDADSDYALEREVGGRKILYNPVVYDGENLGRFVNQGGLLEGLKAMAQGSDVDNGSTGLRIGEVNATMAQHTNVVYAGRGYTELHVQTRTTLTLSENPIELLATYQLPYWILYTLRHHKEMDEDNPIKVCVLWTLLSEKSAFENKTYYLQGYEIEDTTKQRYENMPCPFPVTTNRAGRRIR